MPRKFSKTKLRRKTRSTQRFSRILSGSNKRQNICWNCFTEGHLRFQCPLPKSDSCSFCRRPNIKTVECGCNKKDNDVINPPIEEFENIQIEVLYVEEEEDRDILEICAEDEPLE